MRKIDFFVGVPLCYLLAGIQIVKGLLLFKPKFPHKIKKILVVKFLGIGSIALTAPALMALKDDFPEVELYYLTFKNNKEIINLLNLTHKNFYIDTETISSFCLTIIQTLFRLRKEKIDLIIDFEFFSKLPLIIGVLGKIKYRAGFYLIVEWWRKYLLDYLGYYNHYFHIKDIFLSLVYLVRTNDPYYRAFDRYQEKYTLPVLSVHPNLVNSVKVKLAALGASEDRAIIVINPNAGPELTPHLKRWPPEHFAQLIEKLNHTYKSISIVLIGSRSEREYVQSIIDKTNNSTANIVINFAGETTLEELLGLFSLSNIFITVDSGPMHLASFLRIPTVGFFGAETPVLYAPLNERAIVLCKQLYSVPMFTVYNGKQSSLTDNIPLQLITVDEVYENIEKHMNNYPVLCIASFAKQLISKKSE
ncbi:MAG: glycosyltransferase family 9 protein [bacterium]|nr:glycosyltransferase family 9 protein [bacterium]